MNSETRMHELPANWIWVKIGNFASVKGGKRLPKGSKYSEDKTLFPYIRVSDFKDETIDTSNLRYITEEIYQAISRYTINCTDIYISIAGTIGLAGTIPKQLDGANLTENAAKIILDGDINSNYLCKVINSLIVQQQIHQKTIATTQPKLALFRIEALEIPLPPLNEQHRIVAKIEALTDRSRKARAALDAIPALLDQFRQSVLAAAFRGDLTADWRAQNPDVEWQKTTLNEVIKEKPRNGYSPKAVDYSTQVKSFSLSATTSGEFKAEHFKYIADDIPNDSYLWLKPGDILIQRSNTLDYVGTSAIYTGDFNEFIYPDLIMKVQVREDLTQPKYIHYLLSSKQTRDYFKVNATGTAGNMPKINQKVVMNTPVLLPSIKEQSEIVNCISKVFETAYSIENYFQQTEHDLTTLDQSILARAFRGQLVPQDPNDEPASFLLERIRAEREKTQKKKGKGKKGKGKR